MRAFADFGTPLMMGEGYRTFTVEIYNQFLSETGSNYNFASAISVIAVLLTAVIFLIQNCDQEIQLHHERAASS